MPTFAQSGTESRCQISARYLSREAETPQDRPVRITVGRSWPHPTRHAVCAERGSKWGWKPEACSSWGQNPEERKELNSSSDRDKETELLEAGTTTSNRFLWMARVVVMNNDLLHKLIPTGKPGMLLYAKSVADCWLTRFKFIFRTSEQPCCCGSHTEYADSRPPTNKPRTLHA